MIIKRSQLIQKIYSLKGKFFYVEFIKKDGSLRKMICRTGVVKYVKNPLGDKPLKPITQFLTVWDTDHRNYRKINLDTVTKINCQGISYTVE